MGRCLSLALLVLVPAVAEATNGLKLTAYGPRAAGRGGVDYAYSDDAIGPANNPAGMAFVYGNRFDQNFALIIQNVSWSNSFGTFDNDTPLFFPVPAFSFGVFLDPEKDWELKPVFDLGRWGLVEDEEDQPKPKPKVKGDGGKAQGPPSDDPLGDALEAPTERELYGGRMRIGLGVFPLTGGKIKMAGLRTPFISQPVNWETDVLSLVIAPSMAFRFNQYFSAGLTLQVRYTSFELDGGIAQPSSLLRDDFEFANSILNVNPQILTIADIDDAKTDSEKNNGQWGFAFRLGVMFNSRYVSAGLVYQERTRSTDLLGRATVDATDEVRNLTQGNFSLLRIVDPSVNPALGFASVYDLRIQGFEMPRQVGLGFAVRPHERVSIGFDYTFIQWSEVSKTFKARLSNGSNPNLDIITSPSIAVRVPLNFRDQHVIAFGLSVLTARGAEIVEGVPSFQLVLRTGYNYAKSATPPNTTLPQQPTIAEHHLSAGFTFHWGPLVELNFAWEWALPTSVNTGNHVGNFTLSNSKQELSLMFFHFGLGVNF
ncbi:MAG: OmpP1/FadL family transporter [Planctomycetota bacterium]